MSKFKKHFCDHCDDYNDVKMKEREVVYEYKDEEITINENYLSCKECGHEVYDEEIGNETMIKLRKKYYKLKHKMGIKEFKTIRGNYNLTQVLFAKALNWSESTIKRYETGVSLPDSTHIAIYKVLNNNPASIVDFYEETKDDLTNDERNQIEEALQSYLTLNKEEMKVYDLLRYIYANDELTNINGFTKFQELKLINMVIFFAYHGVLKTKLMKLLWYTDFLMYKKYKKSISGISYLKYKYGPVPKKFNSMLGAMESINKIEIFEEDGFNGYTKITIESKESLNTSIFDEEEIKIMNYVNEYFKDYGSKQIADYSHKEKGWLETEDRQEISYEFADLLTI
ncbi:MAG: type II TA system antitoxin MqsA family protein [bacterium]